MAKMILQRVRVHWPGFQRAALLFVLIAAVMLGVYYILSTENARRLARPEIAGWDDIEECGSLTSFDGTKTLEFERDNTATLTEKSSDGDDKNEDDKEDDKNRADKPERKVSGTWTFDEEKEHYTVSFEGTSVDYKLVKPEDSSVCILAPGDVEAVNLRESWFGKIEEE
jgi:hypothetical protein